MAAYTEPEKVRILLSRSDDQVKRTAASLDDAHIQANIDDAQATVDSYLALAYTVPFTVVPALVTSLTGDIAAYLSDLTFRQGTDYDSELDPVYLRYKRAIAMLEALKDGVIVLPGVESESEDVGEATVVNAYDGTLFLPGDFDLSERHHYRDRRLGWF